MIDIVVSVLLLIQFSSFSLARSAIEDDTPTSTVLLYVEIIKFCVSTACAQNKHANLCQKPFAILVPTLCFVCMNIVSYYVVSQISATTYVMLMQLKIPMTSIVSFVLLKSKYSINQMFCIFLICLSCMNICYSKKEIKHISHLNIITIGGCILEVFLSSMCSVYMQKMFDNKLDLLWIRNMELSFLSMLFYTCIILYNNYPFKCSLVGYMFSALGACGGILVALTLIYCGAVEKTIASSMAIVVVAIAEHLIYNTFPVITNVSFYSICFASVFMYHAEKLNKVSEKNVDYPLLREEQAH